MGLLRQSLFYIIVSSLLFYVIVEHIPGFGFSLRSEYSNHFIIYVFLGLISWFFNFAFKGLLSIITKPISIITFGIFSLFLNFLLLYVFEQSINYLDVGVVVTLGNVVQVFVLSCLLSLICFLVKKI